MDAVSSPPIPVNEPVLGYAPGSPERAEVTATLDAMWQENIDLPSWIGAEKVTGHGEKMVVTAPFEHGHTLGTAHAVSSSQAAQAVDAALEAGRNWRSLSFDDRAGVFLRAAELLSGPWRARMNASTMLGQAKTIQQAEIDAACELADFLRFNVHFAREILQTQPPVSPAGVWNRTDYRPLEGFVYAVTPFNFTAIGANLAAAPALMGNTVVWKPSHTQGLSAHVTMALLAEAGLPPGVINMVHGAGPEVSDAVLTHPELAGLHFTGSTATFQHLWRTVGENISGYRSYPRLVGETGGKDFVLAHSSADPSALATALVRGAFEYQGQKCSAASRAYIPRSVWAKMRDELISTTQELTMGPTTDLSNFMSAVIDERAFARHKQALERAATLPDARVLAGGTCDDSVGYYVRPTIVELDDPSDEMFSTEYFGPILAVHVYPDEQFLEMAEQLDSVSRYALTGAVFARDQQVLAQASDKLRYAAGNFYLNDKPTGAVVGQQPFGGARGSGTNDKAGSALNLLRWVSPRTIKETFVPPTDYRYPHQG